MHRRQAPEQQQAVGGAPLTLMMYRFLAPVLSAQFMTAPTGKPRDILNLLPAAPEPRFVTGGEERRQRAAPDACPCKNALFAAPTGAPD